jgi:hypothetical protein
MKRVGKSAKFNQKRLLKVSRNGLNVNLSSSFVALKRHEACPPILDRIGQAGI